MPEAVIVATARSPIGRAMKGSLVDGAARRSRHPDGDRGAGPGTRAAADQIDDLLMGCGQPAGEQGFNIARVVAVLAGLDDVPGVTVNRYCSSSLQTIRMAAHAIKAGEGDAFIAAGVECVSRYGAGASDTAPNPVFAPSGERTRRRAEGGQPVMVAAGRAAGHLHRHGTDGRERARARRGHPPGDGRVRRASQQRAVASVENGFFEREIAPVTLPDGSVVSTDDGPRPGTTVEKLAELKPVFRPDGEITAGNACPSTTGPRPSS